MSGTQNDKRLDIQLLRAVSVLAVIWYHLDPKSLGGGYLGVDVFFVISGYLITRIFLKSEGKFSIKAFYKRRVCRLFPALLGVLLIVFAYTVLVMQPVAFLESIRSLAYSGLQIANFYFIQGTGYFEGSHDNSPLLHCWSLGVEEQFYLFWAPFYLLLWNKCKNSSPRLWVVVLWIAIGSLAIDIALKLIEPKAAFYLPLPRAWELLLGAILALTEKNNSARRSPLFWWIGVSVILISLFFGKSEGMLDLVSRLFACTGAAICLRHRNLLKSKLWRPWTYIGDISYSLYLWHWPIICLAGLHGVFADQWQTILILIGASLFMGVVSFHGIEEVWRKRQSKGLLRFWLAAMIAITAAALFLEGSKNATWRVSPSFETENYVRPESIRNVDELRREGITIEQALLPETTQRQVALLVGDSHAGHFLPLVETWAEATGHQLELYQQGASLSFSENIRSIEIDPDGTVAKNLSFADRAQYLRSYINEAKYISHIFIAHRTANYISEALPQERWQRERGIIQNEQAPKLSSHEAFEIEFRKFITLLENKGIKVVLLGQAPPLNRHPNYQITLADKFKEKVFKAPTPKFENTDLLLNPKILDRLNFETNLYEELSESSSVYHLKTRNYIPKPITSDGVLLYRDDDHLNQSGALILAPALNQLLE